MFENKQQVIHVASEIVALVGLTFYFNQKNKKLLGHIEDLAQRVEEQEDLLQKHEAMIRKLCEILNQHPPPQAAPPGRPLARNKPDRPRKAASAPPPTPPPPPSEPQESEDDLVYSEDEDHEEDLDAELVEELNELITPVETEADLKKEA